MADPALERNKDIVRSFFDRLSAGDVAGAFGHVAQQATWFGLSTRKHTDAWEMKKTIEEVFSSLLRGPIRQELSIMTAEDDRVAVVAEGHSVTVDDVAYDNMYHFLFRLREGQITEVWEFLDTALARAVFYRGDRGGLGLGTEEAKG
jgi:uncharacterized protein